MTITATLPWPPAKASLNGSQRDFRGKAAARKAYKEDCGWSLVQQRLPVLESVGCVTVCFHPPKNFRFDLDNMLGRTKQGLDAIAEAIGVDDAEWRSMRLERGDKRPGGLVVVEIEQ